MKKGYKPPNAYELGSISKLTAGSISSGSETSTTVCGSCGYNVFWRNTSTAGHV